MMKQPPKPKRFHVFADNTKKQVKDNLRLATNLEADLMILANEIYEAPYIDGKQLLKSFFVIDSCDDSEPHCLSKWRL